jgi:hypothetical protein
MAPYLSTVPTTTPVPEAHIDCRKSEAAGLQVYLSDKLAEICVHICSSL